MNDDAIFAAATDAIERRARAYMLNRTEVEALAEDVLVATRSLIEDAAEADLRERLAAAIEAAGHPDGYHRVGMSREEAGIYCADCAVTSRSARIVRERP